MYSDPLSPENGFEKFPGSGIPGEAQIEMANQYETGNPPFGGEQQFGTANETNEYYGEKTADQETGEEYDKGLSDASAAINYGLDAAAREKGVEFVIQTLRNFYGNTIEELYAALGIKTAEDMEKTQAEGQAANANVAEFREGVNAPSQKQSPEGFTRMIADMKELILEVEGADPKYEELRAGARAAGKGYFEYAVSSFGTQGLTELFKVLAMQREKEESLFGETKEEEKAEEDGASDELFGFGKSEEETPEVEKTPEEKTEEERKKKEEELLKQERLNPEIINKDAV